MIEVARVLEESSSIFVRNCTYDMILASTAKCEDVLRHCDEVPESLDLFKLRYCYLQSAPIFYITLVKTTIAC